MEFARQARDGAWQGLVGMQDEGRRLRQDEGAVGGDIGDRRVGGQADGPRLAGVANMVASPSPAVRAAGRRPCAGACGRGCGTGHAGLDPAQDHRRIVLPSELLEARREVGDDKAGGAVLRGDDRPHDRGVAHIGLLAGRAVLVEADGEIAVFRLRLPSTRAQNTGSPSTRGQHIQTIAPERSSSAEILPLPITARSMVGLSCIIRRPPASPEEICLQKTCLPKTCLPKPCLSRLAFRRLAFLVFPASWPSQRRTSAVPENRRSGPRKTRRPRATLAAQGFRRLESRKVAAVVADHDRPAARERRALHEVGQGRAFRNRARDRLRHHLAWPQVHFRPGLGQQFGKQPLDFRPFFLGQAIMHGNADVLRLDQNSGREIFQAADRLDKEASSGAVVCRTSPPVSSRISAPCTPAARSRAGASIRSMSASERPVMMARAPSSRSDKSCSSAARPGGAAACDGVAARSIRVPSKSRKIASGARGRRRRKSGFPGTSAAPR